MSPFSYARISFSYARILSLLITAGCAPAQVSLPVTISPSTTTTTSSLPPIGIAGTETAQLILANTATAASSVTTASCNGSVSFYNTSGTVIGTATSFTIAGGQMSQVSLPYASTGSSASRALVRAVISLTTTFPSTNACTLSYSLSTFDTTSGVTHSLITGTAGPASGLLGLL
jgi:hypothetical protein